MNFIYGQINQDIVDVDYTGETTSTASVDVDNDTRTISVNVLGMPEPISSKDLEPLIAVQSPLTIVEGGGQLHLGCTIQQGPEGPQGEPGVGIQSIATTLKGQAPDGGNLYDLNVELTNGTTLPAVEFEAPRGPEGQAGTDGLNGRDGTDGLNGRDGAQGAAGLSALTCGGVYDITNPESGQVTLTVIERNRNRTPEVGDIFTFIGRDQTSQKGYLISAKVTSAPTGSSILSFEAEILGSLTLSIIS